MNTKRKAYIYLLITVIAWGSLYVAGKYVLEVIPAFTLLFLRYLIGVSVLLLVYRKGKHERVQKEDYKYIIAIGVFGYFLGIGLQLLGNYYCDASLASLINSTNPVVIVALAIPILKEKATVHKMVAVAITVIGAIIIVGNIKGGSVMLGVILSIGAVLTWSLASVLVRFVSRKYNSITITVYGMVMAMLLAIPASVYQLIKAGTTWSMITPGVAATVIYIGIVCTAIALLFWNKALSMIDAATCSLFYPLQPVVSTILGVLLLGEKITANFILGGLLIGGAIIYAILTDCEKSIESEENV